MFVQHLESLLPPRAVSAYTYHKQFAGRSNVTMTSQVRRIHVMPAHHRLVKVHFGRIRLQPAAAGDVSHQPGSRAQVDVSHEGRRYAQLVLERHVEVSGSYGAQAASSGGG